MGSAIEESLGRVGWKDTYLQQLAGDAAATVKAKRREEADLKARAAKLASVQNEISALEQRREQLYYEYQNAVSRAQSSSDEEDDDGEAEVKAIIGQMQAIDGQIDARKSAAANLRAEMVSIRNRIAKYQKELGGHISEVNKSIGDLEAEKSELYHLAEGHNRASNSFSAINRFGSSSASSNSSAHARAAGQCRDGIAHCNELIGYGKALIKKIEENMGSGDERSERVLER